MRPAGARERKRGTGGADIVCDRQGASHPKVASDVGGRSPVTAREACLPCGGSPFGEASNARVEDPLQGRHALRDVTPSERSECGGIDIFAGASVQLAED